MMQIQTEAERQGVGALFPRVHVSETRVSGLRAPPRNKMALFEQFTIPPHRFVPPPAQQNSPQEFSSDGRFDTTSYYVKPTTVSRVQYQKAGQVKRRQPSAAESSGSGVSCDKDKHQVSSGSVTKAKLCCSVVTSNGTAALALDSRDCNPSQIVDESTLVNLHTKKVFQGHSSESAAIYPVYQRRLSTDIRPPHCKDGSTQVSKDTMAILCSGHIEVESYNAAVQYAFKDTPSSNDKMDSLCSGHIEVEVSNAEVQSASKDASSSKDTMASLCGGLMEVELKASNDGVQSASIDTVVDPCGASNGNGVKDFEAFVSSVVPSGWPAEGSPGIELCGGKTMSPIEGGSHECEGANDTTERMQEKLCSEHTVNKETLSDRNLEIAGNILSEKHRTPIQGSALVSKSSVFSPKIIPKHVISAVGQREFWEARKTILQQQKTLSLQVFELHRLVKVQQLIAGMPGLLLEENDKCTVLKSITKPVYAKVSKGLDDKELADKETKYCTGQKPTAVKQPKKLKVSCHHDSTKVYKQYDKPPPQLHPPSSPLVSFGQSRVSSWGLPSTPFVGNQWLKAVSDKYGSLGTHIGNVSSSLVSGSVSMALQSPMPYPIAGRWYNDHQVWQASSNVFMGWYRPCTPKDVVIPPPVSQKPSANCGISHLKVQQFDFAPGAQATDCVPLPNRPRSALRKSSASTSRPLLSTLLSTQVDMPITNVQQVKRTSPGRWSSDLNKLGSQVSEPTQDLHVLERTGSRSLPGSCEIESERSGMRSQKIDSRSFCIGHENTRKIDSRSFCIGHENTRFTQSDGCVKVVQPASAGVFSLNERCGGPKNGPLPLFPLAHETDRLFISESSPTTSKVIRAVPHSGTAAVQSAAKILKSIQQDWHH